MLTYSYNYGIFISTTKQKAVAPTKNEPPPIKRRYKDMAKYYISHNDYFGFCVIEEIDGTGKIVFAGSIEDCNRKCIELNNTL